jgi:hypothetical protein
MLCVQVYGVSRDTRRRVLDVGSPQLFELILPSASTKTVEQGGEKSEARLSMLSKERESVVICI